MIVQQQDRSLIRFMQNIMALPTRDLDFIINYDTCLPADRLNTAWDGVQITGKKTIDRTHKGLKENHYNAHIEPITKTA